MKIKKLTTGVITVIRGTKIIVDSKNLKKHPLLNKPIRGKIIVKTIPNQRPNLNDWFQKHF